MANQGNYDHPSYLTRQMIDLGITAAAASGTTVLFAPAVSNLRLRRFGGQIVATQTNTGGNISTAYQQIIYAMSTNTGVLGTATLATFVTGTFAVGYNMGLSTDVNYTLQTGYTLVAVGSSDAAAKSRY